MGRFFALAHRPNRLSSASWIVESKSGSTSFLPGMSVSDVDFSRDGAWITYVSIPERALWRSKLDGSERLQLTNPGTMWAGLPRWSPDCKQIVFMGRTWKSDWRAYLISADGGTPQDLVPEAVAGFDPNWSECELRSSHSVRRIPSPVAARIRTSRCGSAPVARPLPTAGAGPARPNFPSAPPSCRL